MIDEDRLDELDTLRIDDDVPDEDSTGRAVRISLPARDVRDLVSLISVVRAAIALRDEASVYAAVDLGRGGHLAHLIQRFDEERARVFE